MYYSDNIICIVCIVKRPLRLYIVAEVSQLFLILAKNEYDLVIIFQSKMKTSLKKGKSEYYHPAPFTYPGIPRIPNAKDTGCGLISGTTVKGSMLAGLTILGLIIL